MTCMHWSVITAKSTTDCLFELDVPANVYRSSSGHYTAIVLGDDAQWWHLNDERAIPVPEALVLKSKAYMLFYKRRLSQSGSVPSVSTG